MKPKTPRELYVWFLHSLGAGLLLGSGMMNVLAGSGVAVGLGFAEIVVAICITAEASL